MADAPPDAVDALYGAPLDEFVALRDARAKELRRAGHREEADAVKRLRKPGVVAWAVNQIGRRNPDAIDGLMAAGAALRQARAGALRTAAREEREAVNDLVEEAADALREAGREPSSGTLDDIRQTLHAAAADEEARELVAAGRVVEPLRAIGLGGEIRGGTVPPRESAKPRSRRAGTGRAGRAGEEGRAGDGRAAGAANGRAAQAGARRVKRGPARGEADARAARQAERELERRRLAAAREAARTAKAEVRDRERELQAAERELQAAERELRAAEHDVSAARAAADKARATLDAARDRLEQRESDLADARGG